MDSFTDDYEPPKPISIWRENHGNWLLGLLAVIVVVGSLVLAFNPAKSLGLVASDTFDVNAMLSIEEDSSADDGPLLTVKVMGANSDRGQAVLAIYNAADQFNDPSRAILQAPRSLDAGVATWVIAVKKLPERFAIATFHDENADGLLDRSVLGIPTEPYGFSNQVTGKLGPPSFDQAVLNRPQQDLSIEIFLGAKNL